MEWSHEGRHGLKPFVCDSADVADGRTYRNAVTGTSNTPPED